MDYNKKRRLYYVIATIFYIVAMGIILGICYLSDWSEDGMWSAFGFFSVIAFFEYFGDAYTDWRSSETLRYKTKEIEYLEENSESIEDVIRTKFKFWGVLLFIFFLIWGCNAIAEKQERERERTNQFLYMQRLDEAYKQRQESEAKRAKEKEELQKIMKQSKKHRSSYAGDGYLDGIDDADLDHEIKGEYGQNFDDMNEDPDYEDGYDDGDW